MKNPIFLFLLLGGFTAHSQTYKFQAVQFICTRFRNETLEPPEFKDLKDMPVEFDMDSSIIYIHSPNLQIFHLDPKPIRAWEEDSIAIYKFNATDKKGVKCIVSQRVYESEKAPYFAAFVLEYPDKTYMYYVERE